MDLNNIAAVAAIIVFGYYTVQILSGKKLEEFLYSSKYKNASQYFFRPKSLIFALLYGAITASSTFAAIYSGVLKGNVIVFTLIAFFSTVFMLLVYNSWTGSVTL